MTLKPPISCETLEREKKVKMMKSDWSYREIGLSLSRTATASLSASAAFSAATLQRGS
jgi:hypothetical protein